MLRTVVEFYNAQLIFLVFKNCELLIKSLVIKKLRITVFT